MKNLSGNANWFVPEVDQKKETEIIIDDRVLRLSP